MWHGWGEYKFRQGLVEKFKRKITLPIQRIMWWADVELAPEEVGSG